MANRYQRASLFLCQKNQARHTRSNGAKMATSPFRKSSLFCFFIAMLALSSSHAVVIMDYDTQYVVIKPPPPAFASRGMHGIVLLPPEQTETGYLIQRSHVWRNQGRTDPQTGVMLTYPPYTSASTPSSSRKFEIRRNISRAHSYRLDYYKK